MRMNAVIVYDITIPYNNIARNVCVIPLYFMRMPILNSAWRSQDFRKGKAQIVGA